MLGKPRVFLTVLSFVFLAACAASQSGTEIPSLPLTEPAGGWKQIQPADVDGLGGITNDPNLIINGKFVSDHSVWNSGSVAWWTTIQSLLLVDLGKPCVVSGLTIQLSTNNDWVLSTSVTGGEYKNLVEIKRQDFKWRWGMETVSSLPDSPQNLPQMAFQPVEARYIKIQAVGGVNYEFSVAEISVFGNCPAGEPAKKKSP